MRRNDVQDIAFRTIDSAKLGIADPYGILQHGCEHRLKIARRTGNDLQHIRRSRLLLQQLAEFMRALLLCLEQPSVLDRDYRLIGERLYQFNLLLGEGVDF